MSDESDDYLIYYFHEEFKMFGVVGLLFDAADGVLHKPFALVECSNGNHGI